MKCSRAIGNIEAYLGGTLSFKEKKRFDRHIKRCQKCRAELERCVSENELYRKALAPKQMQGTLRNIVLARVRFEYTSAQEERRSRKRTALWLAPIAAAAQFMLAFWLSSAVMSRSAPQPRRAAHVEIGSAGRIFAVRWVRGFRRSRYYPAKRAAGTAAPELPESDMQVD